MKLYQNPDKPLRIYIQGDPASMSRLLYSLNTRFCVETESSRDEDEIDNIVFSDNGEYYFPAGLLSVIIGELNKLGIGYESSVSLQREIDEISEIPKDILDGIELREYQLGAIHAALSYKQGLLQLPTGAGKTEIMIGICKKLLEDKESGNILVCVPTANLLHQTHERMVNRGVPDSEISCYGDGMKMDGSCRIIIATVQTAYRRLDNEQFCNWYNDIICLIMDEAHHSSCNTWYTIIDTLSPEYNLGLSAEPFYGDQNHMVRDLILRGTVGSVIYKIPIQYLIDRGYLSKPYMIAVETNYPGNIYRVMDWHLVNKSGIVTNKSRNDTIKSVALELIKINKNPLILVQQIAHGNNLAEMISANGYRVAVLTGGMKVSIYQDGQLIDSFRDSEGKTKEEFQAGYVDAMIGTSTMDEGVDVPVLSAVILAASGKSKLKLLQRIGRGLRPKKGDNTTFIIDFQDRFSVVLHSQFKKRRQMFADNNIPVYLCRDVSALPDFMHQIIRERLQELSQFSS